MANDKIRSNGVVENHTLCSRQMEQELICLRGCLDHDYRLCYAESIGVPSIKYKTTRLKCNRYCLIAKFHFMLKIDGFTNWMKLCWNLDLPVNYCYFCFLDSYSVGARVKNAVRMRVFLLPAQIKPDNKTN